MCPALDTALDRTVLGGYTKLGYQIRRRSWPADDLKRLDGKVVVVTGATSGIGQAAAEELARLGATVWLAVRSQERGEAARQAITEHTGNTDVHVGLCDLSSNASIRRFAAHLGSAASRLDVLVNNAGVMTSQRETSADGIELTLATNVVGPFLLTALLVPLLERTAPARIVNVSSGGMYTQRLNVDELQSRGGFDGPRAYARTKRGEVVLTEMWANRLRSTGVVVHAMHPGWVDTTGLQSSLPRFQQVLRPLLRSAEEGADTIVWLATADQPGETSGGFWHDRRRRPTYLLPRTRETPLERSLLWSQCIALSGWKPDE